MGIFCSQDKFQKKNDIFSYKSRMSGQAMFSSTFTWPYKMGIVHCSWIFLKTSICKWHFKHIHCPAFTKEQIPFLPLPLWNFGMTVKFSCLRGTTLSQQLYIHEDITLRWQWTKENNNKEKKEKKKRKKEKWKLIGCQMAFPYAINSLH